MSTAQNQPRYNQHRFQCPNCSTRYEPGETRIALVSGQWWCRACAYNRPAPIGTHRPVGRYDGQTCANCLTAFNHVRRVIARDDGALIHYRCPKPKQAIAPP